MAADLIVSNVGKEFAPGKPVVDEISFEAVKGEVIVLLGPSGCGKTTTLRMVAGLERPTVGQIEIGGRLVNDPAAGVFVKTQQRDIGMVFQSYAIWPHMTVYENVVFPLHHRRASQATKKKKVGEALELVGLSEHAQRSVVTLSGGQMQRVALARSLAYDPKLLLLDEPLSNLDAKLRLRLRSELRQIIKQAGVTAMYVTHDQSEAVVLGDRIAVMNDGKVMQLGTTQELYNAPANLFVAAFTGATNAMTGMGVEERGNVVRVKLSDELTLWGRRKDEESFVGQSVTVSLRPENLRISSPVEDGEHVNQWHAYVADMEYLGTQTTYTLECSGQRLHCVEVGSIPCYAVGDKVSVSVPPESVGVFPSTERPLMEAAREVVSAT